MVRHHETLYLKQLIGHIWPKSKKGEVTLYRIQKQIQNIASERKKCSTNIDNSKPLNSTGQIIFPCSHCFKIIEHNVNIWCKSLQKARSSYYV